MVSPLSIGTASQKLSQLALGDLFGVNRNEVFGFGSAKEALIGRDENEVCFELAQQLLKVQNNMQMQRVSCVEIVSCDQIQRVTHTRTVHFGLPAQVRFIEQKIYRGSESS